jgi:hypothetical protein
MTNLSDGQARLLRLVAQQLVARQPGSAAAVAQVVRGRVGVQAQEPMAAMLSLRARCQGLAAATVEAALGQDRRLVRTWCLRGTLHLVAAEDLAWLLALLAPGLIRAGTRRRAELGLDIATGRRGVRALADMLRAEGPLTRAEIAARLARLGIPTAGQATIHLISLAALEGAACYGPDRDGEATFVALERWIEAGPILPPQEAATELARRYLTGYGPATPEDLAAWSGLKIGEARAAWQRLDGQLLQVTVRGSPAWLLQEDADRLHTPTPAAPVVRLVSGYDPHLLGYRGRDLAVDPEHARQIHPGGGVLHQTILVDGRAAGIWTRTRRRSSVEVSVRPFLEFGEIEPELQAEIRDVTRFLEGAHAGS